MKTKVYNLEGKETGEINLSDEVFGVKVKPEVVHEVFVALQNNQREPWADTKNRGEVRGGGKKPWQQKGTGRARHGSTRSAQYVGGGIIFGPKPRSYSYTLPKKLRRLALKSVLSSKLADKKIIVVDDVNFESIKTAAAVKALKAVKAGDSALIVLSEKNQNAELSFRNIPTAKTAFVNTINVFDILKYDSFLVTKAAVEKIEEVYV